jgi:hypothetical protein
LDNFGECGVSDAQAGAKTHMGKMGGTVAAIIIDDGVEFIICSAN